jgi:hypothetical protein
MRKTRRAGKPQTQLSSMKHICLMTVTVSRTFFLLMYGTKVDDSTMQEVRDRPEVEITPEIIQAGVLALDCSALALDGEFLDQIACDVVGDIYEKMQQAREKAFLEFA